MPMYYSELDASFFDDSLDFYDNELIIILEKICQCYNLMIKSGVKLENDENKIRDVLLLHYLKNNDIRNNLKLSDYLFDREVPEDFTVGRTDIKISTQNTFHKSEAYYILECKRLDNINTKGISGLNSKYIEKGICRFSASYYNSYYKKNGMIGFVVVALNIQQNVDDINNLIVTHFTTSNTIQPLTLDNSFFQNHYLSKHTNSNSEEITLHHLMFDFSGIMI